MTTVPASQFWYLQWTVERYVHRDKLDEETTWTRWHHWNDREPQTMATWVYSMDAIDDLLKRRTSS